MRERERGEEIKTEKQKKVNSFCSEMIKVQFVVCHTFVTPYLLTTQQYLEVAVKVDDDNKFAFGEVNRTRRK